MITARVRAGKLTGAGDIGVAVGKVISKYNTAKHFDVTITDDSLAVQRRQAQIDAESALDGFYVIRTAVPASELGAPAVVTAYKNLKYAGRDFRHLKADDLDLRPIWHRLEERVRAHVLICMLACYLTWHLRKAWAPLTFTDQHPPAPGDPVAPARRSAAARAKASRQHDQAGRPYRSFRGLLAHLGCLTRNQVCGCSPSHPASSAKRSTSSGPRSRSPCSSQNISRQHPPKAQLRPDFACPGGRNFGLMPEWTRAGPCHALDAGRPGRWSVRCRVCGSAGGCDCCSEGVLVCVAW